MNTAQTRQQTPPSSPSATKRYAKEKGNQRYCPQHHFTGGACVMCHYNPLPKNAATDGRDKDG